MRRIWMLLKKDAHLHWRAYGASLVGLVLFSLAGTWVMPRKDLEIRYPIAFNLSIVGGVLYGQWLIDREKSRRTLAWLRTMPVSDSQIVVSKVLALAACQAGLFSLILLATAPEALSQYGLMDIAQKLLACVVFGTWLLVGKWLFGERLGQAAAAVLFLLLLGVGVGAGVYWAGEPRAAAIAAAKWPVFVVLFLALSLPVIALVAILGQRDTADWVR